MHGENMRGFVRMKDGAIEGMPLYLLIIVIITVVSIGIIVGLMSAFKPPATFGDIHVEPNVIVVHLDKTTGIYKNDSIDITVIVSDSQGNRVEGAVVSLEGNNISTQDNRRPYGTTDSNGMKVFKGLKCQVIGTGTYPIKVKIEKSGYPSKTIDIPVVKE